MAKQSQPRSAATSRIRVVMFDAELADGGISEFTQAITTAIRSLSGHAAPPTRSVAQVTHVKPANGNGHSEPKVAVDTEEVLDPPETEQVEPGDPPTRSRRSAPRAPKVVEVEVTGDPSFEDFAKEKNPDNERTKNLVVLYWLKQHGNVPAATVDQVFTCFRFAQWDTTSPDFAATLRGLKREGLVTQPERGKFAINRLGDVEVERLGAPNT